MIADRNEKALSGASCLTDVLDHADAGTLPERMLLSLNRAKVVAERLCGNDICLADGTVLIAKESHRPNLELINEGIATVMARYWPDGKP